MIRPHACISTDELMALVATIALEQQGSRFVPWDPTLYIRTKTMRLLFGLLNSFTTRIRSSLFNPRMHDFSTDVEVCADQLPEPRTYRCLFKES